MKNRRTRNPFSCVLIIGVGLVGGSIAAALKELSNPPYVIGVDTDPLTIETACSKGILDEGTQPDDDRVDAWLSGDTVDLIVLATPVSGAGEWLSRIERCGYDRVLTDVASTKGIVCSLAEHALARPDRFIPGHPMAGSEVNGLEGARANLFQGAHWILCPDECTDPVAFQCLHELVTSLGARAISIDRNEHDRVVAIVSHVPHMVASALMQLAGAHVDESQEIFRLAAGGFKDTTRIAAGSPALWCGIAFDNREALADGLNEFEAIIEQFRKSIQENDAEGLNTLLADSAELRRSLPIAWVPDSSRLIEVRIPMTDRTGVIAEVTGIAGKVGCNIQSIDIDHITEDSAVLELVLTDEGDIGRLSGMLIDSGFDVSLRPLTPKE